MEANPFPITGSLRQSAGMSRVLQTARRTGPGITASLKGIKRRMRTTGQSCCRIQEPTLTIIENCEADFCTCKGCLQESGHLYSGADSGRERCARQERFGA